MSYRPTASVLITAFFDILLLVACGRLQGVVTCLYLVNPICDMHSPSLICSVQSVCCELFSLIIYWIKNYFQQLGIALRLK
uniref:Uncharacterized protein n=1 Tax=Aegilops tauschii subsp. strangulata TaxID=200361 RepID=A0A453LJX9_AEGTS